MTDILIKIAAILALLTLLWFGEQAIEGRGYDRARAEDNAELAKQKAQAAATLATETSKTRATEQALQTKTNQQETQDAVHQKTVAALSDRLHHAAGPAGRLRDPNAAGCGAGGGSTPGAAASAPGDRADDSAEAGGLFSAGATELFQRLTREADDINDAYASCRADALSVRGP